MKLPSCLLVVAFATGGSAAAAPCASITFETVKGLSIQQIGQFATEQAIHNGQHSLVLRGFDPEDRLRRGSLQAAALLMVATGDIGDIPVGALVWTSAAVELAVEKLPDEGFRIVARNFDDSCSPVSAEVHVLADGTVLADERKLGKLP